jgi:WD40-like Beta Propeller Repeat
MRSHMSIAVLTSTLTRNFSEPSRTTDGSEVVITVASIPFLRAPSYLVLVKADGTFVRNLTDTQLQSNFASFAPDGRRIVYRVRGKELGLRILDRQDGSIRTLTTGTDNFPFWSPDGSRICFTRNVGGIGAFDIAVFRLAVEDGELSVNPCAKGGRLYDGSRVEVIWSSPQVGAFLHQRRFAHIHLPLLIGLWTGQREGDILRLKWSAYDGQVIRLKQRKGRRRGKKKNTAAIVVIRWPSRSRPPLTPRWRCSGRRRYRPSCWMMRRSA